MCARVGRLATERTWTRSPAWENEQEEKRKLAPGGGAKSVAWTSTRQDWLQQADQQQRAWGGIQAWAEIYAKIPGAKPWQPGAHKRKTKSVARHWQDMWLEEQNQQRSNPDHNNTTPKKIWPARTSEQGFSSGKKNLMATKSKIEPELQAITLPGMTTIWTHRPPEKSKEEKKVAHTEIQKLIFSLHYKTKL
jgi:hypothetical protein